MAEPAASALNGLPTIGGNYLIQLHLDSAKALSVGHLGECQFAEGYYAYVGSAFGPGGIRARVNRHLRVDKKLYWHLDYLRSLAKPGPGFLPAKPAVIKNVLGQPALAG